MQMTPPETARITELQAKPVAQQTPEEKKELQALVTKRDSQPPPQS